MRYKLFIDRKELLGNIVLPASKSISNRLLILNSIANPPGKLINLSSSDDTLVMQQALKSKEGNIDIGHAGTAFRFLTAYLSIQNAEYCLTGSERMKQRPIRELVKALNDLGAGIDYLEKQGYPPLSIYGKKISGGEISVDSSISSQYISALMMIAPALKEGLTINLRGEVVSSSYIYMTKNLMHELDIPVNFTGSRIHIPNHRFRGKDLLVESDWSAASYWYAMAVLAERAEIEILGLRKKSYQGDSVLPQIFRPFGVETIFKNDGIILKRIPRSIKRFEFDFSDNPDLVQTMVVLCGLLNLPFYMSGTRTLKIKETDRIHALQVEMIKLGIPVEADNGGAWLRWDGNRTGDIPLTKQIKTYQDHRMAMAFAPAAIYHPGLIIEDPEVVHKSYPGFWEELKSAGFNLQEMD